MKKIGCLLIATVALLFLAAVPANAQKSGTGFSGGGFKGGGGGGFKGGGGGFKAQSGGAGFAFRGHSGGGGFHHGHGHHHHHGSSVFFGFAAAPVWWWGWPYYYPYYYPYAYPYPAYPAVEQSTVYVQQDQQREPYYWYYCENAQAYYPYVQQCPSGWMKVVPSQPNGPGPKPQ